jgi:hypothetical protein
VLEIIPIYRISGLDFGDCSTKKSQYVPSYPNTTPMVRIVSQNADTNHQFPLHKTSDPIAPFTVTIAAIRKRQRSNNGVRKARVPDRAQLLAPMQRNQKAVPVRKISSEPIAGRTCARGPLCGAARRITGADSVACSSARVLQNAESVRVSSLRPHIQSGGLCGVGPGHGRCC